MADEQVPPVGSVGFWERIGTLGVRGAVTLGLDAAWVAAIFLGVVFPDKLQWVTLAANVWIFGEKSIENIAKLGK